MNKSSFLNPQIVKIDYAFCHTIAAISPAGVVAFKSGKNWVNLYCSNGKAKYDEKKKNRDGYPIFEKSVNGFLPGELTGQLDELNLLVKYPIIARIEFASKNAVVIGRLENPAELTTNFSTANGGTAFEISHTSIKPSPILQDL
jgi:hypothetical protein